MKTKIDGVEFKNLTTHSDERGFFREIIRKNDKIFNEGFGQISYSNVHLGIIKAWHLHKVQTQWTYILNGAAKVALHDTRKKSKTFGNTIEFLAGDNYPSMIYKFPPGVAHGYKCITGPMLVLYITSGVYDIADEIRIPYNDSEINFDWLGKLAIT